MEREVLKKYFENKCSETEQKSVEKWLLDPSNKVHFESFLEEEWDEHIVAEQSVQIIKMQKPERTWLWRAAGVAAIMLVSLASYYQFSRHTASPVEEQQALVPRQPVALPPSPSVRPVSIDVDTENIVVDIVTPKTVQHEKKITLLPKTIIRADSSSSKNESGSVKISSLNSIHINEQQLAKLTDKIDSNELVLNLDLREASIFEIARLLKENHGIVLESCKSSAIPTKMYTARFDKVSIKELLDDMSEQMLFTYTFEDNKVNICFN